MKIKVVRKVDIIDYKKKYKSNITKFKGYLFECVGKELLEDSAFIYSKFNNPEKKIVKLKIPPHMYDRWNKGDKGFYDMRGFVVKIDDKKIS